MSFQRLNSIDAVTAADQLPIFSSQNGQDRRISVQTLTEYLEVALELDTIGGNVATDAIWTAAGQLLYATGVGSASVLPIGSVGQALTVNGSGLPSWTTLPGGGNALTSNPLSQFAATTSAQLAGVLSDETGSGLAVFNNGPSLISPAFSGTFTGTYTLGGTPTFPGLVGQLHGLADPNADRLAFWDDSTGTLAWLTLGTNLSITDTTLNATGGGAGLVDGDYGDVIVGGSGTTMAFDSNVVTTFARTLLDDVDAAAMRATLGVGTGGGDASTNTGVSVDSEMTLFSGTSGKTLKRATGTGIVELTAGVASVSTTTGSGAVVRATSPSLVTPSLGTPTAGTLTNCTGLPIATGVAGLGTGVATFLTTPSSANLRAALTDETGTGAAVFGTSPSLSSPTIATPTLSGLLTMGDGAQVITPAAMTGQAINVDKALNTETNAVDRTFTFTGTPTTGKTFAALLTNSDTAVHIYTMPTCIDIDTGTSAAHAFPVQGGGKAFVMFRYNGTAYELLSKPGYLNKYDATAAPTVNDDIADGFGPGSEWLNATGNTIYKCESNAAGAAVWHLLNDGSGSSFNFTTTARILARKTAGAGAGEECTLSEVLDFVGSAAQGDILIRGASTWTRLGAAASSKYYLQSGGAAANPSWALPTDWGATSAISSAATTNIGALAGSKISIGGTTTITAFDTVAAGITKFAISTGTFTLTHNTTSLNCPGGADIAVASDDTFVATSSGSGNWRIIGYQRASGLPLVQKVCIPIAVSDETTALTTGTAKVTFRMPFAMTLTAVRASVTTAPTGSTIIVDINEGGTSIMTTTKLSIDASEKTSTTAASQAALTDTALADDAEITIDIDQIGSTVAGAGLKVYLIGTTRP